MGQTISMGASIIGAVSAGVTTMFRSCPAQIPEPDAVSVKFPAVAKSCVKVLLLASVVTTPPLLLRNVQVTGVVEIVV